MTPGFQDGVDPRLSASLTLGRDSRVSERWAHAGYDAAPPVLQERLGAPEAMAAPKTSTTLETKAQSTRDTANASGP